MTSSPSALERQAMARALAIAARATGIARPNPGVGCILLRDGEVVGEGATEQAGGAHAEVVALRAAGDAARGATAVTTLEPCNHQGRTGPCSVALAEAGIVRLVHAATDDGPEAAGGAGHLRATGVEVVGGLFEDWAEEVHRTFLLATRLGRPAVTVKVAQTSDGAMALHRRRWVTGAAARVRVHELRALADAVLVGVSTVLADDPHLGVREAPAPAGQPRVVVLDSTLRTPPTAKVVARGALVITTSTDAAAAQALQVAGAEVLVVSADKRGRVDVQAALQALGRAGVRSVLAESGPTLGATLAAAGVVDDVVLHIAPDVADGADLPTVARAFARPLAHDVRHLRMLDDDLEIHFRPAG